MKEVKMESRRHSFKEKKIPRSIQNEKKKKNRKLAHNSAAPDNPY
jgi:hypothetical protein